MEIFTLQFWLSVGAIILMDLSLGGDNAVVIAMASNRLPEKERKKAILIGTIGAVGLRMALTAVAVWLLTIPLSPGAGRHPPDSHCHSPSGTGR